jgi:WD40 repeat protein
VIVDVDGQVDMLDLLELGRSSQVQGLVDEYHTLDERFFDLEFSQDGRFLISCGFYEGAVLWNIAEGFRVEAALSADMPMHVENFAVSPDSLRLVTAGGNANDRRYNLPEVMLWDVAQRRVIQRFEGHPTFVRKVELSPDGRMFATADTRGNVFIWESSTGRLLPFGRLTEHEDGVDAIAFSPDNGTLVTGGADGAFKVWDLPKAISNFEKPLISRFTKAGYAGSVWSAEFTADGRTLLVGAADSVEAWDTTALTKRYEVPGRFIAIPHDGAKFATAGGDEMPREIAIWETATGSPVRRLQGAHRGIIRAVSFSPNGRVLASGGDGGIVRLWNVETGETLKAEEATRLLVASTEAEPHIRTETSEAGDQAIARWVISIGGSVDVLTSASSEQVSDVDSLPLRPFTVTAINLTENKSITDSDLQRLRGIDDLQKLYLGATGVTDAALESIQHLKRLNDLHLQYTKVTASGLAHLQTLTALRGLDVSGVSLKNDGVDALLPLVSVDSLSVNQTGVTDEMLFSLAAMKNLKHLHVTVGNDITPEAIRRFNLLLPECQIH